MAKIERGEDLPTWFRLEKYSDSHTLTSSEWFAHLYVRQNILGFLKTKKGATTDENLYRLKHEDYCLETEQLRTNPISLGDSSRELWVRANQWINAKVIPVRDMSFYDIVTQYQIDQDEEHTPQAERWKLIKDPYFVDFPRKFGGICGSMIGIGEPVLVNLDASDVVLKDAFGAWLRAARARQNETEDGLRRVFPERWARYGLLPYLDLFIWAEETGNHIPDRVMSAAVRLHDAGESNLRKTVVPLAADLMRGVSRLRALLISDATRSTIES